MIKLNWGKTGAACFALAAAWGMPSMLRADMITLTDHNSIAKFDTSSQSGMYDWIVDGKDHMFQQAFWYRVGNTAEEGVHSLTQAGIQTSDTNSFDDNGLDTLTVRYSGRGFNIDIRYTLQGGSNGSGISDVAEQIKVTNTGQEVLDFHFFQYNDYDLGGTAVDNSVVINGGNTATQTDESATVGEVVVTPAPTHFAVDTYANQLGLLTDESATTLSDFAGALTNGDLTWAFQWDFSLGLNQSYIISKDKNLAVVPVPGAALLGMLGLGLVGAAKRRLAR